MTDMIYKIQIDATGTRALAYTEGRQNMIEITQAEHVNALLVMLDLAPMTKTYVLARREEDGMFAISGKLDKDEYPEW